jgi:putative transposase
MPRPSRLFLLDQPLHIIQRGNDRQRVFFADEDHALYRHWLAEAAREYGPAIHAYGRAQRNRRAPSDDRS